MKIRCWDKRNKRYTDTVTLFASFDNDGTLNHEHYVIVEQYTGLKDKTGKEIFEGDLLVDRYPIDEDNLSLGYYESLLPVVWDYKNCVWCVDNSFAKNGSSLVPITEYFLIEHLEVKGNIHKSLED